MKVAITVATRIHQFELIAVGLACVSLSIAVMVLTWQLRETTLPLECYVLFGGGPIEATLVRECPGYSEFASLSRDAGRMLLIATGLLPFAVGTILGAPLVAREIESGTAILVWSLDARRRRWLFERTLPIALMIAFALGLPAAVANALEHASNPSFDPGMTFRDYGSRGVLVVVRGLVVFATGLLVGALLRRVIPSLIVTAAMCVALGAALPVLTVAGHPLEAVAMADPRAQGQSALLVDTGWRGSDEDILTDAEARSLSPYERDPEATHQWLVDNFEDVALVISGERYKSVEGREAAILGVIAVLLMCGVLAVVGRAKPY